MSDREIQLPYDGSHEQRAECPLGAARERAVHPVLMSEFDVCGWLPGGWSS
jgi:hypothetical protein